MTRKQVIASKIRTRRRKIVLALSDLIKQSQDKKGNKVTYEMIARVAEHSKAHIAHGFRVDQTMTDKMLVETLYAVEYITGKNIDHILEG